MTTEEEGAASERCMAGVAGTRTLASAGRERGTLEAVGRGSCRASGQSCSLWPEREQRRQQNGSLHSAMKCPLL